MFRWESTRYTVGVVIFILQEENMLEITVPIQSRSVDVTLEWLIERGFEKLEETSSQDYDEHAEMVKSFREELEDLRQAKQFLDNNY